MDSFKTANKNTKNECFVVRVEGDWEKRIKNISKKLDIPMSAFIRNSVDKNIRNI